MKCSFGIRTAGILVLSIALSVVADDWPQWRGPQRNGVSQETGLLKEWPKDGPKLIWKITDAGSGYSTRAVVKGQLYLLGNAGLDDEFVQALAVKDGRKRASLRARVGWRSGLCRERHGQTALEKESPH
ncbi:MAG: hypothetical protein DME26_12025 [Verrucomicrobia bacterium]|nr:MAG: hypothetical protein DME26_12025 [Verrucomicrobiota bacterium]